MSSQRRRVARLQSKGKEIRVNGYTPKELPSFDYLAMAKQLHAIGNNIHQIAARANATGFFMVNEYEQYMNDVYDAIARIEKAILDPEKH